MKRHLLPTILLALVCVPALGATIDAGAAYTMAQGETLEIIVDISTATPATDVANSVSLWADTGTGGPAVASITMVDTGLLFEGHVPSFTSGFGTSRAEANAATWRIPDIMPATLETLPLNGTLARLVLDATDTAAGVYTMTFTGSFFDPATALADVGGNIIPIDFNSTEITVVPEPGTVAYLLGMVGMIGLVRFARNSRRSRG